MIVIIIIMNALKVLTLAACMMGIAQCTELKLFPACMHAPAALIMAQYIHDNFEMKLT